MNKIFSRFPRAKYLRQLHRIQRELDAWRAHYLREAGSAQTPWTSSLLQERSITCDWLWHEVGKAADCFEGPMRWPK